MGDVIVTIHGINTFGQWQDRLTSLVAAARPDARVVNYKYGLFSIIRFFIPLARDLVTRKFRAELKSLAAQHPGATFHLVAHSFGTHIAAWGLYRMKKEERPKIGTVILAGSVLKPDFPWSALLEDGSVERVINDCGLDDWVLVLNQAVVLFTGMAGRIGFVGMTSNRFRNRWFRGGHSHYFEKDGVWDDSFMKAYWLDVLCAGAPALPVDQRERPGTLANIGHLILSNATPIKMAIYAIAVWLPALWVWSLYQEAEHQRREAVSQRAEAISQRNNAIRQRNAALRTIEWVVKETVHFDYDLLELQDDDSINIIAGIPERLKSVDYQGRIMIAAHVGQFCLDPQKEATLMRADAKSSVCQIGYSREYAISLGQRLAEKIKSGMVKSGIPETRVSIISYGREKPSHEYPNGGTAGEWNRIARLNNRVEMQLIDE